MWGTATGVAATMEGRIVPPAITQATRDTNRVIPAIVRRAIPDTGVRQLRLHQRMPARTLARRGQATQAAIGLALAHLRLYRPMSGTVRVRCRLRSPGTGRAPSRRGQTRSLDRRGGGRKVTVGR